MPYKGSAPAHPRPTAWSSGVKRRLAIAPKLEERPYREGDTLWTKNLTTTQAPAPEVA